MNNFECHVTVVNESSMDICKRIAEHLDWKLSTIDGDPLLGTGNRIYFTKHHVDFDVIVEESEHYDG